MIFEYLGNSKFSGIYEIRNRFSNKSYIGSAKEFKERWRDHVHSLKSNKHQNKHLQRSINKGIETLGHDNFLEFHVIEVMKDSTKEQRLRRESYWIKQAIKIYGRKNIYNTRLDPSHEEGKVWSYNPQESKKKISKVSKGRVVSEETRKRLSEASKNSENVKNHLKRLHEARKGKPGRPLSEEHKKKLLEANKGRPAWNKGKSLSEEHKKNISLVTKREKNPSYGKHHSEESRKKMSEAHKGMSCPETAKEKLRIAFAGRFFSEETRRKLKEAWVRRRRAQKLQMDDLPISE